MDRRKFIGGLAGNLVAVPLSVWVSPLGRVESARAQGISSSLASLAANTARNLGPYASAEIGGANIIDFSSITYDRIGKRMCLFGGGHGPSQETDIRIFDLATLQWSSLYAPTPRSEMTQANADSDLGRWVSTNQPYARHSYNMTLVVGRRFYMMQNTGMPDHLDGPQPAWGGRICWYDFDTATWQYSRNSFAATPWYYASAAVLDPVSGKIIVLGQNSQAGAGAMWVFDPTTDTIATGVSLPDIGYSFDAIYFPPNDRFYVMYGDGRVWEVKYDRTTLESSTVTPLAVSGVPPSDDSRGGFSFDPINRIIGGKIVNGTFYALDPMAKVWSTATIQTETAGTPNQTFHCLEFDPDSGCFIFLSDWIANTTWAYRYAGSTAAGSGNVSDLAVALDFGGGQVASFSGANALDKGDFVGEFVRQKCYLAIDPAFPDWRVFFRVDADANGNRIVGASARDEVIIEYGRTTHGAPVHRTAPYTATITKAGIAVYSYVVPKHWWGARWRYQSSQRPVVRTPALLKSRGWIPNFGPDGLFGTKPNTNAVLWAGPFDAPVDHILGAFFTGMSAGGDNPQIGHATEYAADYIITGSSASLTSLRTEGEWFGNACTHFRDDVTGDMLDVRTGYQGYKADGGLLNDVPANLNDPAFIIPECAHMYPCASVPWLLTEDPFFLEELQFICNWALLFNHIPRLNNKLPGLVYQGETRAYAWGLRDQFICAASTPMSVPSWLQPQSYWKACVDDNKVQAMKFVNCPALVCSVFRCWTRTDLIASWMSAWLSTVVGTAVRQGFSDWKPIFDWSIEQQIRLNSEPGWKQWPTPYYWEPDKAASANPFAGLPADTARDATTCKTWAEAWAFYKSGGNGNSDLSGRVTDDTGWDGLTFMSIKTGYATSPSYFLHTRAALATAVSNGTPGAQVCYDNMQTQLATAMAGPFSWIPNPGQARFAIDPSNNFGGLWWKAPAGSESGWGINFAHQGDVIFATWFTYDLTGSPWWLSLTAYKTATDTYAGTLYETNGPPFNAVPFDPASVTGTAVGTGTLIFSDANNGTFAYVVNGYAQTKAITREVFASPVPACAFGTLDDLALATNFQDLWWNSPAGSEAGWGMNLTHQGDTIVGTWFTYDLDGSPLWLTVAAPKNAPQTYSGILYRPSGPPFSAVPFDPAQVAGTPVGTATFTFSDGNNATFSYVADNVAQTKQITRQVFRAPGTVCF